MLVEETKSVANGDTKDGVEAAFPVITWVLRSLYKLSPEEQLVMVSPVPAEKVTIKPSENVVFNFITFQETWAKKFFKKTFSYNKIESKPKSSTNLAILKPLMSCRAIEFPENSRASTMTKDRHVPGLFHEQVSEKENQKGSDLSKSRKRDVDVESSKECAHDASAEANKTEIVLEFEDNFTPPIGTEENYGPWTLMRRDRKGNFLEKKGKTLKPQKTKKVKVCKAKKDVTSGERKPIDLNGNEEKKEKTEQTPNNVGFKPATKEKECKTAKWRKKIPFKTLRQRLRQKTGWLLSKEAIDCDINLQNKKKIKEVGEKDSKLKEKKKKTRKKSKFSFSIKKNANKHEEEVDNFKEVCIFCYSYIIVIFHFAGPNRASNGLAKVRKTSRRRTNIIHLNWATATSSLDRTTDTSTVNRATATSTLISPTTAICITRTAYFSFLS